MPLRTIDAHDAAALTIIADYPNMPDDEFEEMLGNRSSEFREMARRVRERSARSSQKSYPATDSDDATASFVRSVAASAGRL